MMTVAATAMRSSVPKSPPASPRTRNRRHAAVKLNSAVRNAAPSAKPPRISAADAACQSSVTRATRIAVAAMAALRYGQSCRAAAAGTAGAAVLTDVIAVQLIRAARTGKRSGAAAKHLLEVVPFGAGGGQRAARIGAPLGHRAGIDPHVLAAQDFGQDEPVGGCPMAGVAIG